CNESEARNTGIRVLIPAQVVKSLACISFVAMTSLGVCVPESAAEDVETVAPSSLFASKAPKLDKRKFYTEMLAAVTVTLGSTILLERSPFFPSISKANKSFPEFGEEDEEAALRPPPEEDIWSDSQKLPKKQDEQ
ncbi:hypothetical protein CYMTET_34928, partial [Cymbomonas tetramitiformis]